MADTTTSIAGIPLNGCVYNASGARCETLEELRAIAESRSAAILAKSCTLEPRRGNPEPRYWENELGSINSMGLPNLGHRKYLEYASHFKDAGKPYIVSVAGLNMEENITIIRALADVKDVAAIELNLSCPNVPGKPQTSYDSESTERLLTEVEKVNKRKLGVKLAPFFDMVHFDQMAEIIKRHDIRFLTLVNSIGNGLIIDPEKEQVVIKPKGGFGGIGGDYLKPTALANVRRFHELLPEIDIIGVGGIKSGADAFEFILAGAGAVQVGTELMRTGVECFGRIEDELKDIMERKGYSSIGDFRGKLKKIS